MATTVFAIAAMVLSFKDTRMIVGGVHKSMPNCGLLFSLALLTNLGTGVVSLASDLTEIITS